MFIGEGQQSSRHFASALVRMMDILSMSIWKDIKGNDIQTDMQRCTMGIYVISKDNGDPGHSDDIGIFVEGVISLDSYLGSEAQACAVMLGVIYELNLAYLKELRHCYELNLAYPKELRHYYEFIPKGLM